MDMNYELLHAEGSPVPIKGWVKGVPVDEGARRQLDNLAQVPFVGPWVAVMPDVHLGIGATVGSVIPTRGAIIPAAVGVDIGCGMAAVRTTLTAEQLPDDLGRLRSSLERGIPVGNGRGGEHHKVPASIGTRLRDTGLADRLEKIRDRHPKIRPDKIDRQLGTLGGGNHFVELCLDEADGVWIMLHSGSRGVGNRIGSHFIELAKEDMRRWFIHLPDQDLAYLPEGTEHFDDYVFAVGWAQEYARTNRELMMEAILEALRGTGLFPTFEARLEAVNCHHNYVDREHHFGENVFVTRKGAVRARSGDLGIIPGSMGARSYIVRGRGNALSFHSCSHGAGRAMSRAAARRRFTVADHAAATAAVECRKDADVIDETPMAYKSIDAVMEAQRDLVEVVHTLKQIVCVKG